MCASGNLGEGNVTVEVIINMNAVIYMCSGLLRRCELLMWKINQQLLTDLSREFSECCGIRPKPQRVIR